MSVDLPDAVSVGVRLAAGLGVIHFVGHGVFNFVGLDVINLVVLGVIYFVGLCVAARLYVGVADMKQAASPLALISNGQCHNSGPECPLQSF